MSAIRRRWPAVLLLLAVAGIVAGVILLARSVPGVARLLRGEPPTPTRPADSAGSVPTAGSGSAAPAEWIAFETKRGSLDDFEIFVVSADGTRLANVTNSWADDAAPAWSPDGRQIAFVSLRDTLTGKGTLGQGSIYVIGFDPVAGIAVGEAVQVTHGSDDGWPSWSPDGQRIAFHSNRGGDWEIWVVNLDGTGLTNLTNTPGEDRFPAWSPDGSQIAFASKRDGNYDVWVMAADGSSPTNLTRTRGRDRYPTWSPDGSRIAFNTNRDGNQEIYIMNADGTGQTNLTHTPNNIEGLASWAPDGQRLVLYSDLPGNKDEFVVDLVSGEWRNITNDPTSDEYCAWSP
jgi:Tol biopolymer transport system component